MAGKGAAAIAKISLYLRLGEGLIITSCSRSSGDEEIYFPRPPLRSILPSRPASILSTPGQIITPGSSYSSMLSPASQPAGRIAEYTVDPRPNPSYTPMTESVSMLPHLSADTNI